MINDNVDPFISKYRDDIEHQRDLAFQNLDNTRRNDFANMMGAANTAGMMYSNFPQRAKKQYDTATYEPNQVKIQSTYQTGLDKLRSNVVNLSNQLKNINDAISDLNNTNVNGGNTGTKTRKITIDGVTYNVVGDPRTNDGGGIEYDLDDGKGVLLIDPNSVKQVN